jgi:uncharacterized protein
VTKPTHASSALRWLRWLGCALLLALWAAAGHCGETPDLVPQQTGLLVDQAGALDAASSAEIEGRLEALQSAGRAQVAILISSGTGDEPLADFSLRVAQAWRLGHAKADDGLLIVVVPSQKAARIEVGYGLEGAIPDVLASRWLDELMPTVQTGDLAPALAQLLARIDKALPAEAPKPSDEDNYLFPDHPEWRLPFVLVVFSPFAIFPLFAGRWAAWASAALLAAFLGGAAWMLWDARTLGLIVGGLVFPLPLAWSLNAVDERQLAPWQRGARLVGNAFGVAMFFAVITLFVGAGLSAAGDGFVWAAPLFAGVLAIGLAVFLFPGRPANALMVVLRSVLHLVFMLVVAYVSLAPFVPDPLRLALSAAGLITALVALGLYADGRETARPAPGRRWSAWFFSLAALLALPLGVLALLLAIGGDDFHTRLMQAAAGSGSIAAVVALAAKYGLIAALRVGLGGLFGGGGAQRGG